MNRLTLPHFGGKGHYMKCSERFACNGECGDCEELDKIVEKLAEYEDRAEKKTKTNADRIRAMTDEELACIIEIVFMPNCNLRWDCEDCIIQEFCQYGYEKFTALEWLQQPVKED